MLALVDFRFVRKNPLRRAPAVRTATVLGLRVLMLTADIDRKTGRCDKTAAVLRRTGADAVCLCDGFPAPDAPGLPQPGLPPLHTSHMEQICAAIEPQGDTALLVGSFGDGTARMLDLLARRYRYVMTLGLPHEAIEAQIRKTGVAVLENPSPQRVKTASLAVLLSNAGGLELSKACLAFSAHESYLSGADYERYIPRPGLITAGETPDGFPRQLLISEALRRGALLPEAATPSNCQILTKAYK